jgi:hypothetical protein
MITREKLTYLKAILIKKIINWLEFVKKILQIIITCGDAVNLK